MCVCVCVCVCVCASPLLKECCALSEIGKMCKTGAHMPLTAFAASGFMMPCLFFVFLNERLKIIIAKACACRLGSRAGPRTGKEERGFLQKKGEEGSRSGGRREVGLFVRFEASCVGGGSHRAGGPPQFCMGRVGLRGRRPDPGLLAPDASRQEAEANLWHSLSLSLSLCVSLCVCACRTIRFLSTSFVPGVLRFRSSGAGGDDDFLAQSLDPKRRPKTNHKPAFRPDPSPQNCERTRA